MKNLKNGKNKSTKADDLAEHYDFDYALAKPNRFAKWTSPDFIDS